MSECELAVVIPILNARETILDQIAALSCQAWSGAWEVVAVDNGSTDGTQDLLREQTASWPRLRVISHTADIGPGHARCAGIKATTAPLLAFCDADDIVAPGWVSAMGDALRKYDFVTGPIDYKRLNPPELAAQRGTYGLAIHRLAGVVPTASSCNFGVRRKALAAAGGFSTLAVGEDLETSYRLWRTGVQLHFSPEAGVHYRLRVGALSQFQQAYKYGLVHPLLMSRLRHDGVARPSRYSGLRGWIWLIKNLPHLRDSRLRVRWFFTAGMRIGRVQGSIRERSLYL